MKIEDFSDADVLAQAKKIHARKRQEERRVGFEEQDTVTIRWNLPTVKGGRPYLGTQGYDGIEVNAAAVEDLVVSVLAPEAVDTA